MAAIDDRNGIHAQPTFFTFDYRTANTFGLISIDKGHTWQIKNLPANFQIGTVFYQNGRLFIFNNSATASYMVSDDGGNTWVVKYLDVAMPNRYCVQGDGSLNLVIAGTNSSFYVSHDNGDTWNFPTNNMNYRSGNTVGLVRKGDIVYGSDVYGRLFRTTDWGDTWESNRFPGGINGSNLYNFYNGSNIFSFLWLEDTEKLLICTGYFNSSRYTSDVASSISSSKDGIWWASKFAPMMGAAGSRQVINVGHLARCGKTGTIVAMRQADSITTNNLADFADIMVYSDDSGETWQTRPNPFSEIQYSQVLTTNSGRLIASFVQDAAFRATNQVVNTQIGTGRQSIAYSDDGLNWTEVVIGDGTETQLNMGIVDMTIDRETGYIYALKGSGGSANGMNRGTYFYVSKDDGLTWSGRLIGGTGSNQNSIAIFNDMICIYCGYDGSVSYNQVVLFAGGIDLVNNSTQKDVTPYFVRQAGVPNGSNYSRIFVLEDYFYIYSSNNAYYRTSDLTNWTVVDITAAGPFSTSQQTKSGPSYKSPLGYHIGVMSQNINSLYSAGISETGNMFITYNLALANTNNMFMLKGKEDGSMFVARTTDTNIDRFRYSNDFLNWTQIERPVPYNGKATDNWEWHGNRIISVNFDTSTKNLTQEVFIQSTDTDFVVNANVPSNINPYEARTIAYGDGVFVTLECPDNSNPYDNVQVSDDNGETWELHHTPITGVWQSLGYAFTLPYNTAHIIDVKIVDLNWVAHPHAGEAQWDRFATPTIPSTLEFMPETGWQLVGWYLDEYNQIGTGNPQEYAPVADGKHTEITIYAVVRAVTPPPPPPPPPPDRIDGEGKPVVVLPDEGPKDKYEHGRQAGDVIQPWVPAQLRTLPSFYTAGPWTISDNYIAPPDCRRIIAVISNNSVELAHTTYGEVMRARYTSGGMQPIFAHNNGVIYLTHPQAIKIVYVKEYRDIDDATDLLIPHEAESYLIYKLAYNIALANPSVSSDLIINKCKTLADNAYDALIQNHTWAQGKLFVNPLDCVARFDADFMGGIF